MRYCQRTTEDGVTLRSPTGVDGAEITALVRTVYGETPYLSGTPDEFDVSDEAEAAFLENLAQSPRGCMIGAWVDGRAAGSVMIGEISSRRRLRHRAELGISVRRGCWGRGIGSMLMAAALETASEAGYEQVELEVAADNARAIRLYEKFGFAEYGRRPRAARREDGSYVDEILMWKRL